MANQYGPWNGKTRIVWEYNYTVSGGAALVSVNAYMELAPSYNSNGRYPVSWWGTWGSGNNNEQRAFSGMVLIVSWSQWVTLKYGSTTALGFGASGTNYWGSASNELYFSLPAQPYVAPRPPKTPASARVSDTQATVTWATDFDSAAGAQPWTGVYIDRWSKTLNTWTRVASLSWDVTSWSDTGIGVNNQYKHRIASHNPAGQSAWQETLPFSTTPSAPTTVSAAKTGSDINVTWTNTAVNQSGAIIYDNGTQVGTVGAGVSTFLHTAPSTSVTHQYTVRATVIDPVLQSELSTPSNIVQLLAPPNPPANVRTEKSVYSFESDALIKLLWQHNPIDSSTQTAYQLRYKKSTSGTWIETPKIPGDGQDEEFAISSLSLGIWEFQVKTWGAFATGSAYSATGTVSIENNPAITIITPTPDQLIDRSRVSITWTYTQAQARPQASYLLELFENGNKVWSVNPSSTAVTQDVLYTLIDGQSYQLRLTSFASNGLNTGVQTTNFTVNYAEPGRPVLTCIFDPANGVNNINVVNNDIPIATEFNRVYRNINPDSAWYGVEDNVEVPPPVVNLFTNPNLVGDGTYAEVRRNRVPSPLMATAGSAAGWTKGSGVQPDPIWTIDRLRWEPTVTGTTLFSATIPVTPGEVITMRAKVEAAAGSRVNLALNATATIAAGNIFGSGASSVASGEKEITATGTVPVGVTSMRVYFAVLDAVSWMTAREVSSSSVAFDGSTKPAGLVQPEDFRTRWTGAENASESVMEIERVRGLTATNCVAGVSTKAGRPAVRQIPTTTSNNSFFEFHIPAAARALGTLIGDLHVGETLTGSLNAFALYLRTIAPDMLNGPTPNQPGTYPLRHEFSVTSTGRALFMHGGAQGSGDVWWTDIGLFAGEYAGPAVSGDTVPWVTEQGLIATPRWEGTPNASPSILTYSLPEFRPDEWEYMGEFPPNSVISDYEGLTMGRTLYLVEAVSEIPSASRGFSYVEATSQEAWLGSGNNFAKTASFPFNYSLSTGISHPQSQNYFFDDRERPVLIAGKAVEKTQAITGTLDPTTHKGSTWPQFELVAESVGLHLFRDMDGRRAYAQLTDFTIERPRGGLRHISFGLTEMDRDVY